MKHLKITVTIIAFIAIVFGIPDNAYAQRTTLSLKAMTAAGAYKATPDTTTDADTTYLYLNDGTAGAIRAYTQYQDLVYNFNLYPSLSGTTTGAITIQGSMTGTHSVSSAPTSDWVTLTPITTYSTSDSVSYTSPAAGGGVWGARMYRQFVIPASQYKYQRIRYISGGTQTSVLNGSVTVLSH